MVSTYSAKVSWDLVTFETDKHSDIKTYTSASIYLYCILIDFFSLLKSRLLKSREDFVQKTFLYMSRLTCISQFSSFAPTWWLSPSSAVQWFVMFILMFFKKERKKETFKKKKKFLHCENIRKEEPFLIDYKQHHYTPVWLWHAYYTHFWTNVHIFAQTMWSITIRKFYTRICCFNV